MTYPNKQGFYQRLTPLCVRSTAKALARSLATEIQSLQIEVSYGKLRKFCKLYKIFQQSYSAMYDINDERDLYTDHDTLCGLLLNSMVRGVIALSLCNLDPDGRKYCHQPPSARAH